MFFQKLKDTLFWKEETPLVEKQEYWEKDYRLGHQCTTCKSFYEDYESFKAAFCRKGGCLSNGCRLYRKVAYLRRVEKTFIPQKIIRMGALNAVRPARRLFKTLEVKRKELGK